MLKELKDGFKNLKIKSLARLRFAVRMFFWMLMAVSLTGTMAVSEDTDFKVIGLSQRFLLQQKVYLLIVNSCC